MTIIVSKMTSTHCAGTVAGLQMREESESGIRRWEEFHFEMPKIPYTTQVSP